MFLFQGFFGRIRYSTVEFVFGEKIYFMLDIKFVSKVIKKDSISAIIQCRLYLSGILIGISLLLEF